MRKKKARIEIEEKNDVELGAFLKRQRMLRGIRQKEAAKVLNITTQALYDYEKGRQSVPSGRLKHYAQYLKISLNDYFENEDFKEHKRITLRCQRLIELFCKLPETGQKYIMSLLSGEKWK